MPITVLTDRQVKFLLNNLTTAEVQTLQDSMRCALHEYATGASSSQVSTDDQPNKTIVSARNGTTTLFMPSIITGSMGIKGTSSSNALSQF
ncbi:putative family decarboxylase [Erysiphe neolycopersici]|uniref:Putative family decarboxylase n=1 Tax=Erysiphe neolycopersici TaxID=212602 RepID=A0A420HNV8_9PEZI|nr:putative family decarboxylase [Erysiphe neolycopersici]